jgi:hypothetical protein
VEVVCLTARLRWRRARWLHPGRLFRRRPATPVDPLRGGPGESRHGRRAPPDL